MSSHPETTRAEQGGGGERDAPLAARRRAVVEALDGVIDPEVGLSVVELGLLVGLELERDHTRVSLTATTPACPLSEQIVRDAERRVGAVAGVGEVHVDLVWAPAWSPAWMSSRAKESLGWSG